MSRNDKKFKELLESFIEDLNQIEDFPDKLFTLLAFCYILEKKGENMFGKILIPLSGGTTKDLFCEKVTMKFESYYKHILEEFDSF